MDFKFIQWADMGSMNVFNKRRIGEIEKNMNNKMELKEYIGTVFPIIEQVCKARAKKEKGNHLTYLYRQVFYGFGEIVKERIFVSIEALVYFKTLNLRQQLMLHELDWACQPKYDSHREGLILEHIYTGGMFRNQMDDLFNNGILTIENICQVLKENYCVAWILRDEDSKLIKSDRGKSLNDALVHYEEKEIYLMEFDPILKDYTSIKKYNNSILQ